MMEKEVAKPAAPPPDEERKLAERDKDFKQACRRYAWMRARTGK